ncbi:MAG: YggS family pyridoxal phosphate-dependent enzyme [Gemmatimonadetes bacterium]|jgi:PLP dependent protein|nr:YggS family pyridoxal phosphate-dependent enzyme [Gemmatimonadota bacterium]
MQTFQHKWEALQERIARSAERAGRDPGDVTVVAVTKTRTPQEVEAALQSGLHSVGENRVQEVESKKPQVDLSGCWHLIGHLQTNKAAKAVALFDMVQSVDNLKLATALDRHAGLAERRLDILVQVNTSGAAQQSGVSPDDLESLIALIAPLPHLRLCGLMTIGAHSDEEAIVRASFSQLRQARDRLANLGIDGIELDCLSMGMSNDFEWAIAEGASMLRLGSVLFGPRNT